MGPKRIVGEIDPAGEIQWYPPLGLTMIDHQRKDRRQTATAAAIRPPALMLDPPLPDPRQINQQLKANARIGGGFVLDQRIDESIFAIQRADAIEPVSVIFPQFIVHERAGHQFGSTGSETLRNDRRQALANQRARRSRLIEQALKELVMPLDQSGGHQGTAIQREEITASLIA